jgi:hypothetical protein
MYGLDSLFNNFFWSTYSTDCHVSYQPSYVYRNSNYDNFYIIIKFDKMIQVVYTFKFRDYLV